MYTYTVSCMGYLAHEKQPPTLGPALDPRYSPYVGSEDGRFSYGRDTPVRLLDLVCSTKRHYASITIVP